MGRGRAKAKQTKVARQLKYQTLDTNFSALQHELGHDEPARAEPTSSREPVDVDDEDDPYSRYAETYGLAEDGLTEDEDEDEAPVRRRA